MLTLCIRYTLDPNRIEHFKAYVDVEVPVLRRSGVVAATHRSFIARAEAL